MTMLRNRSLDRQRRELLQEVGLLQSALLPPVPDRVGGLRTSVAYRPADGPGAGGDFYDVLPLPGGRVGFILGDVSGHGRGALARTAFMRYTLRAYLEAGLEPRVALQVAGRVIDENLGGDFATVLLAVHDPETGSLTYATAGHPAPLVVGPQPHEPVTAGSSPPIGVGVRTGLRQTTVPLVSGSVAAMFTDGLLEARIEGGLLGRERLSELLEEMGDDATARGLVQSVNSEARVMSDDIAAVVIQPTNAATAGLFRTEQLELTSRELESGVGERFLEACGLTERDIDAAIDDARMISDALRRRDPPRGVRQPAPRRGAPAQRGEHRGGLAPRRRRYPLERGAHRAPPGASATGRFGDASGRSSGTKCARVLELDHAGVREQLAPLVHEHRLEHRVAHAPDERDRDVELLEPLVDRAHQRGAAVALGERDVALEREHPHARPVVRERRPVGLHHHRVGVARAPSRRGSTPRTGCRRARGSRRGPRCGTRG